MIDDLHRWCSCRCVSIDIPCVDGERVCVSSLSGTFHCLLQFKYWNVVCSIRSARHSVENTCIRIGWLIAGEYIRQEDMWCTKEAYT